jgi:galactokinase
MDQISIWNTQLSEGLWDQHLAQVYGEGDLSGAKARIRALLMGWQQEFGRSDCAGVYSAPGRTELLGNHTDHQLGKVLAASVNVDMLAAAAPNHTQFIRIVSQGYEPVVVDLTQLSPIPQEENTSAALVRGIAASLTNLGYPLSGVDAYVTSNVPAGSGLSSSAAYEVLVGQMLSGLFCDDALTPVQLAQIGQYAENHYFGKPCGLMDQIACAVGGAVYIDFHDPADPQVVQRPMDPVKEGYALCILDCGADHADLTQEYAAIPAEMKQVARLCGGDVLSQVAEADFYAALPRLRPQCGDRPLLRAMHYYSENRRVAQALDALGRDDFSAFLSCVRASGHSSATLLQNSSVSATPNHQPVSLALGLAQHCLGDGGTVRVHGGGFAGTIQAYVPLAQLEGFQASMEAFLAPGCCHVFSIRPVGCCTLLAHTESEVE